MSLLLTRIQNLRANANLDKYELRPSRYGALDVFLAQTNDPNGLITPELEDKARVSIGSVLETPVIEFDKSVTIGNVRNAVIADSENTSRMHTITFATYAWGFTMTPAMYMNNEIAMQKDFERKFYKYLYAFADSLDKAAVTALSAAKTTVIKDPLHYTATAGVVGAPLADRDNIIGDASVLMTANDFFGTPHLVGNAGLQSVIEKLKQHGLYNDVNKQLEYQDKILHFTNNVVNAANKLATGYVVNSGSLGVLSRFERESILGTKSATGHEWGIETLPLLNMPVGTYYYESVGDFNAIAGAATADMTRARKEHYGFAVDIAFITPFNSDPATIASPILAFDIAKA